MHLHTTLPAQVNVNPNYTFERFRVRAAAALGLVRNLLDHALGVLVQAKNLNNYQYSNSGLSDPSLWTHSMGASAWVTV